MNITGVWKKIEDSDIEIKLEYKRKTSKNDFKRYHAQNNEHFWFIHTNFGVVTFVRRRDYVDNNKEKFSEKAIEPSELPFELIMSVSKY